MTKKTRNIVLTLIMVFGIAAIGYVWKIYGSVPDSSQAPQLSKKAAGRVHLDGVIVPEKVAELGFIVPAKIVTLSKKVGDVVKAGDVLAVQDSADIKAQLGGAQAQVYSAQAKLDELNHDLKKEKLKVHDFSGNARREQEAQVSSNKDSVEGQKSAIVEAQQNLVNVKAQLAKTILVAPFEGIITRQEGEVGEISGASVPSFITLSSNEPLRKIEAFAGDMDVISLKVGDVANVAFDIAGSQKMMTAKVISVDPSTASSQEKSTYKVTLMLENTDASLKSGMYASVIF